jgi:hypothetical protein
MDQDFVVFVMKSVCDDGDGADGEGGTLCCWLLRVGVAFDSMDGFDDVPVDLNT